MRLRNLLIIILLLVVALTSTGCMKRDVVVINPDETAFALPMSGGTIENQEQLFSEANLTENKVMVKRVFIDYERVKTRSYQLFGTWYPKVMVVKISLRPVTRAWTGDPSTGSSTSNQALNAETKESIALSAEFNCNAQVDETNAAKFTHAYYGKQLEEIMDTQVRPYAQQIFTEQAAKYTMDEFLENKGEITKAIREGVTKKFADQGIKILTLGMQGDIKWDPAIQASIDKRIQSQNDYLAQQAQNKKKVEMAEAANREAKLLGGDTALRIKELEIQRIKAEAARAAVDKWNGTLPTHMLPNTTLPFIDIK